jgi:uncharacterized membrane protein
MESLGIILSVPSAFIASIVFSAILGKVTHKLPNLIYPIGPIQLQEISGNVYYPLHVVIFLLTLPALSGIMRLQKKFEKLSKWYSIGCFCAVVGLLIVLQQYVVSEAFFGVDGVGGPYGKP